jgi:signal transduction histidine kinase
MRNPLFYCKYFVLNYWHFVLFTFIIWSVINQINTPKTVTATVNCEQSVWANLAFSKPVFAHSNYKKLPVIEFDTSFRLTNETILTQNCLSTWYKISFDSIPENLSIDFFQYETVIGFEANYQNLDPHLAESNNNTLQHCRHIFFDLPKCAMPCTFYFKVFARTWLATDALQIRFQETRAFHNRINQEFYDNQATAFWFLFVFGVSFFQLLYIGSLAWSRRKAEYIYYWLFVFIGTLFIFISRRFELGFIGSWQNWTTSSIVVYLAIINFFYCRFVRYYLDSKTLNPFFDKQYRMAEWYFLAGTLLNLLIYAVTLDLEYAFSFFVSFTNSIIVLDAYLIFLMFYRQKSPLVKYLMMGAAFIVFMMGMRLLFDYLTHIGWIKGMRDFDAYGSVFGSFIDAICLNLGLNYKHRLDILEKQKALDTIRTVIASDLHDDLGGGLSTIKLLGERAQIGLTDIETKQQIEKITIEANDLIEKMANVIWDIKIKDDTCESLIARLRRYALDYFEDTDINCRFDLPDIPPSVSSTILSGKVHKQVLFTFKEVLHNIVKHAKATQTNISIEVQNPVLEIKIIDNGIGFDTNNPVLGNGLKNMQERMASIGGSFSIFSEKGKGTTVVLRIITNKS